MAKKKKKGKLKFYQRKIVSKKILRKGPRPVLDLRRRPEREVPVKQHGFKEGDITYTKVLNQ